jgi:hypothetical protein
MLNSYYRSLSVHFATPDGAIRNILDRHMPFVVFNRPRLINGDEKTEPEKSVMTVSI